MDSLESLQEELDNLITEHIPLIKQFKKSIIMMLEDMREHPYATKIDWLRSKINCYKDFLGKSC